LASVSKADALNVRFVRRPFVFRFPSQEPVAQGLEDRLDAVAVHRVVATFQLVLDLALVRLKAAFGQGFSSSRMWAYCASMNAAPRPPPGAGDVGVIEKRPTVARRTSGT